MFVGRESELRYLNKKYGSKKSEMVVLYGRRRIGKTELSYVSFLGKVLSIHNRDSHLFLSLQKKFSITIIRYTDFQEGVFTDSPVFVL